MKVILARCPWWNGAPGSRTLTRTGVIPVWLYLPVGVVMNHPPGPSSGWGSWSRRRGGHIRWEQRFFPHRAWSTVTAAWLLLLLLWPVAKIPEGRVMHSAVINNSHATRWEGIILELGKKIIRAQTSFYLSWGGLEIISEKIHFQKEKHKQGKLRGKTQRIREFTNVLFAATAQFSCR